MIRQPLGRITGSDTLLVSQLDHAPTRVDLQVRGDISDLIASSLACDALRRAKCLAIWRIITTSIYTMTNDS